jgi:hypothetical protein
VVFAFRSQLDVDVEVDSDHIVDCSRFVRHTIKLPDIFVGVVLVLGVR